MTRRIVPIALLGCALATPALAAWPPEPTQHVPLCLAPGASTMLAAVSDGAGGTIVVWQDQRLPAVRVFAQRVSGQGIPLWAENGNPVTELPDEFQGTPVLIPDGSGGAIIAWEGSRTFNDLSIYAQRIDANGDLQWGPIGIEVAPASGDQEQVAIAPDGSGGAILAWAEERVVTNLYDIYAQRLSSDGTRLWNSSGNAVSVRPSLELRPRIAVTPGPVAAIAWEDLHGGNVRMQVLGATGDTLWSGARAPIPGNAIQPILLADGSGGWLVFCSGQFNGTGQRFDAAGNVLWGEQGVELAGLELHRPDGAVSDGAGGAIVLAYHFEANGPVQLTELHRILPNGTRAWGADGARVCNVPEFQFPMSIVADGMGGAICTWADGRHGEDQAMYAQRVNSAGVRHWFDGGVPVAKGLDYFRSWALVANGSGGAIAAWTRFSQVSDEDAYAHGIDALGAIGTPAVDVPSSHASSELHLETPSPNPMIGHAASIRFFIPQPSWGSVTVLDVGGRTIRTLHSGSLRAGPHSVEWDGENDAGRKAPAGIYFVELFDGSRRLSRKLIRL